MVTQMLNPIALDLETAPVGDAPQEYALQPWRLRECMAEITCISVGKADGESLLETHPGDYGRLLRSFAGQTVSTWNGVFDVAWLIAQGHYEEVKAIQWIDAMVLWKWKDNSQLNNQVPKWSLADGVKKLMGDEPWADAFITMKKQEVHAGDRPVYWENRAKLDAIVTAKLTRHIWDKLNPRRRKSAMINMASIVPVANSWVIGVDLDFSLIRKISPEVIKEMAEIELSLGVQNSNSNGWMPSAILRSPQKLANLIYTEWDNPIKHYTPKDAPATHKAALTYLADTDDRCVELLRWRALNTQLSKYLEAPVKARDYLRSDTVHPAPKLFSTYTGRLTYSSKTSRKYPTGVALHQWPRNKVFRELIKPRPGYKHAEWDAAGQESRIMADASGDINMIAVFNDKKDFHSVTGAKISGMSYDDFIKLKHEGNSAVIGEHGFRYQGKFTGLSNNFRIGVKKLRIQARVQYGMKVDFFTAKGWQDAFLTSFPGIQTYWKKAIQRGKDQGYAESLAGRRYQLMFWGKDDRWSTESSAIMHPIQGSGADMKDLAIQEMAKHFPEFIFWFDLHDGLHYQVKEDTPDAKLIEARDMLDALDYTDWWGVTPKVPFTWDVSVGARWSKLEEL